MKRYIFAAIALLASLMPARAAEVFNTTLIMTSKTDDVAYFRFENKPVATFTATDVTVKDNDNAITWAMANVKNFTFKTESHDAIEAIAAENGGVIFTLGGASLSVDMLAPGTRVEMYSVSGMLVASATADEAGHLGIGLDNLPSGVYIVAAPGHSFKFIK